MYPRFINTFRFAVFFWMEFLKTNILKKFLEMKILMESLLILFLIANTILWTTAFFEKRNSPQKDKYSLSKKVIETCFS